MVYTTNACNFRCTYCEQEHIAKVLQTDVMENILKLVQHMSKKVKKIKIDWFGGEPLLEYKKMQYILEKANSICDKEGCELYSTIATNGYLLSDELLEEMKKCNLQLMQITLDGKRTVHDARRKLVDGSGTFEKILENINKALEYGIRITLRINIDEQNVGDISEVLEGIPLKYRSLVYISISNIFQNKELLSTYQLLKKALDMGFSYAGRENTYVHCHACLKNAAVIDTDGSILLCSNTKPEEKRMGYLDNSGQVRIERLADYYKLKSTTALDNPECRECIELPYCIGSCKYSRMQNNKKCLGRSGDGMMLKERALLDYYYDLQKSDKVIE